MNIRSITSAVAVLVMSTAAGSAQDWTKGSQGSTVWTLPNSQPQTQNPQVPTGDSQFFLTRNLYAYIDGGIAYQQDATLEETISSGTPPAIFTSGTATFNPGIRGNIALGYDINRSWAAEFDTGVLWNSVDGFDGTSLSSVGASFDTYTIPLLVNIVYRIPIKGPWSSYLGAGAGGAASILSYSQTYLGTRYSWDNSTFVFGYQAKAGLQYKLNKNASLDVAYEFFGSTDPSWSSTQTFGTPADYQFKEKGFYTHSLVISFTWNF
ncbi:MAG: outer membrane protein [Limisphaerales bacterium]